MEEMEKRKIGREERGREGEIRTPIQIGLVTGLVL